MKLRNKKTGKIVEFETDFHADTEDRTYKYSSLAKLNEDWKDYEEQEDYWFINGLGDVIRAVYKTDDFTRSLIAIGNHFETPEEAEKAVEKLKAWKQLKDNCNFRFNGVERDERGKLIGVKVEFDKAQVTFDTAKRCYEILDLLFGGEE